jgi:hypothetical protein
MTRRSSHPILSSLGEFLGAGLRPKTPLASAIVMALWLKLAFIVAMRTTLFSAETRPHIDERAVSRLIGSAPR